MVPLAADNQDPPLLTCCCLQFGCIICIIAAMGRWQLGAMDQSKEHLSMRCRRGGIMWSQQTQTLSPVAKMSFCCSHHAFLSLTINTPQESSAAPQKHYWIGFHCDCCIIISERLRPKTLEQQASSVFKAGHINDLLSWLTTAFFSRFLFSV
jgi:hypothetical protein